MTPLWDALEKLKDLRNNYGTTDEDLIENEEPNEIALAVVEMRSEIARLKAQVYDLESRLPNSDSDS